MTLKQFQCLYCGQNLDGDGRRFTCDACMTHFTLSEKGHLWVYDWEESKRMNDSVTGCFLTVRYAISRCHKCACIQVFDTHALGCQYKPAEWTWNAFKTLKEEPPCPATWE